MPLESLQPGKAPDVRRVSAERPEIKKRPDVPFYPETDITSEELKLMKQVLDRLRGDWGNYCQRARETAVMFPGRQREFKFGEEVSQAFFNGLSDNIESDDYLGNIRQIFPEKIGMISEEKLKDVWQHIYKNRDTHKTVFGSYCHYLTTAKFAFPEKFKLLDFDESIVDQILEEIENNKFNKLEFLYYLRILFPQKFNKYIKENPINKEFWESSTNKIRKGIDRMKKRDNKNNLFQEVFSFYELAVIAADDIQIGPNGLELVWKDGEEEKSEVPIKKQY